MLFDEDRHESDARNFSADTHFPVTQMPRYSLFTHMWLCWLLFWYPLIIVVCNLYSHSMTLFLMHLNIQPPLFSQNLSTDQLSCIPFSSHQCNFAATSMLLSVYRAAVSLHIDMVPAIILHLRTQSACNSNFSNLNFFSICSHEHTYARFFKFCTITVTNSGAEASQSRLQWFADYNLHSYLC